MNFQWDIVGLSSSVVLSFAESDEKCDTGNLDSEEVGFIATEWLHISSILSLKLKLQD